MWKGCGRRSWLACGRGTGLKACWRLKAFRTGPVRTERTVVAGDLVTGLDRSASHREERALLGVRVGIVVQKLCMICGQDKLSAKVRRAISIHCDVFESGAGKTGQRLVRNHAIEDGIEPPYDVARGNGFTRENACSVDGAGSDSRFDHEHVARTL